MISASIFVLPEGAYLFTHLDDLRKASDNLTTFVEEVNITLKIIVHLYMYPRILELFNILQQNLDAGMIIIYFMVHKFKFPHLLFLLFQIYSNCRQQRKSLY